MVRLLLVVYRDKEAGIHEDWQRRRGEPYQSHLPLPCLSTRHFFPKPSMCFLFVAKSTTPLSKQPAPMRRGRTLVRRRSAPSRMHSRITSEVVHPSMRAMRRNAACALSSSRACTVALMIP